MLNGMLEVVRKEPKKAAAVISLTAMLYALCMSVLKDLGVVE